MTLRSGNEPRLSVRLLVWLAVLVLIVGADLVLPFADVRLEKTLEPPGRGSFLGTDRLGRDVGRLLIDAGALTAVYGGGIAGATALLAAAIALAYGANGVGGHVVLRLLTMAVLAVPSGLLMLLAVLRWPRSPFPLFLGILLLVVAVHAERLTGEAGRIWRAAPVQTARQLGVSAPRVAVFYVFPLLLPVLEVVVLDAVVKFVAIEGLVTFIGYRPWGDSESFGSLLKLMYSAVAGRRPYGLVQFGLLVGTVFLIMGALFGIVRNGVSLLRAKFRRA